MVVEDPDELNEGAFDSFTDVSFNHPGEEEVSKLLTRNDFTRLEPFSRTAAVESGTDTSATSSPPAC